MKPETMRNDVQDRACNQLDDIVGNREALGDLIKDYVDQLIEHLTYVGDDWTISDVRDWSEDLGNIDDGATPISVYTTDRFKLWSDLYIDEDNLMNSEPIPIEIYRVDDVIDYELAVLNNCILSTIEGAVEHAIRRDEGLDFLAGRSL